MPSQHEQLAAFRKSLSTTGFDGDPTDAIAVDQYIEQNPSKFTKGVRELHRNAVKALSAEVSPDGLQALVSWNADGEAAMPAEDEPKPEEQKSIERFVQLNRKTQELETQVKSLNTMFREGNRGGDRVKVALPGEMSFDIRKSLGLTTFKSAEHAHDFGLWIQAQLGKKVFGDRAENASKSINSKYGRKDQQTSPIGDGGATIAPNFINEVLTNFDDYGIARQYARNISMPNGSATLMEDKNGIVGYYIAEGATITASDIDWGTVELRAKKLGLKTVLTSEIIQDSAIAIAEHVASRFVDATQQKEDEAFFLGDGTNDYGGINGLAATFSAKASNYRNVTGASGSLDHTLDHINELKGKMPRRFRKGAAFHCHTAMTSYIFDNLASQVGGVQMKEIEGYGFIKTFLGIPIVENYVMNDDPASSGDVVDVYYANFAASSVFGDTRSLSIKTSDVPLMDEDKTLVVGTRRYDINHWNLGASNSQSPVIALWQD